MVLWYNSLDTHSPLISQLAIMAVPFIQIGQCGNQIGQAFFNTMHE